jgi:tetratricopeptide (TPR) repeat protein
MGDSYKALGETEKAEEAYKFASQIIPSRFYPKYLLAILYDETSQKEKAIKTAKEILQKEIKIESTAIREIHEEMEEIIKNIQHNDERSFYEF